VHGLFYFFSLPADTQMAYQVTARKWRPRTFDEVVAQEHITTTLKNAIQSGRIAQAYLFCGPRGVGKTTTARILAKVLNCPDRQGSVPCDQCSSCRSIAEGTSMNVLEIDGASNNSVEDVRELREVVRYTATEGRYKIYIIDEVHMLSTPAFNALLKTLEEPPAHVIFIFATTEARAVPETILSRCQRFNFRRIPTERIAAHLKMIAQAEGLEATEETLFLLASRAEGALRDAESLLDQVVACEGKATSVQTAERVLGLVERQLYFELMEAIGQAAPQRVLELVARAMEGGADVEELARGLAEQLRHVLFAKVQGSANELEVATSERPRYQEAAAAFAEEVLLRMLQVLMDLEADLKRSVQPRFRLEIALVRLALMERAVELGQLLRRLEEVLQKGGLPAALPAIPPRPQPVASAKAEPAAPAAAEGPLSLERVRKEWDELVQEMSRLTPALAIFLKEAALIGLEGRVLKLAFSAQDRFPMNQVVKNRESVEAVCAQRWGQSLRLDCQLREAEDDSGEEEAGSTEVDPTVKTVLDAFDGELV
jgi:DNA polymerase-3 subunit gamma/tau